MIRAACLLLIGIITGMNPGYSNPDSLAAAEGEKLFVQNCKACHHLEMRLVGPALKGVEDRHSQEWLYKFIRSSQSMVQAGDSAAVALFNTYNSVIMPDQKLSDTEINAILTYVRTSSSAQGGGGIQRPDVVWTGGYAQPLRFSDFRFWIIYTVTVLLVVVSIYYKAELVALRKRIEPETPEN